MKVETMWWCTTCRRRISRPLWQNPGRPDQWAYHLAERGWGHGLESAPLIQGEVVPAAR